MSENKTSFFIHILHYIPRWQGYIEWLNDGQVQYFSSIMEMIKIFDKKAQRQSFKAIPKEYILNFQKKLH